MVFDEKWKTQLLGGSLDIRFAAGQDVFRRVDALATGKRVFIASREGS